MDTYDFDFDFDFDFDDTFKQVMKIQASSSDKTAFFVQDTKRKIISQLVCFVREKIISIRFKLLISK